jgi:DNA (cytosine-5)-methyltransferase 1
LDLGFARAGYEVVLANDNDAKASESHRINFPETAFFEGSIAELSKSRAESVAGRPLAGEVDMLIGGPPCPPFSKSRFYRTDKPRAMQDPIGAITIGGYLETLRWMKPRGFVMENVPGMAFGVHHETLDFILSAAESMGYSCEYRILNAADYGVPQTRQRFFLVGSLDANPVFPDPSHSKDGVDGREFWRTAGDAIADLDTAETASDAGHVAGGKYHSLLEEIPPGDNYLYLTAKRGHPNPSFEWRKRYWSFLLKLSPDLPSWTIQARRSNNMGPLHWRNRILRIEEVKRLQTFPDDFRLVGTVEQQWRQVGNAVPPELALSVAQATRVMSAESSRAA